METARQWKCLYFFSARKIKHKHSILTLMAVSLFWCLRFMSKFWMDCHESLWADDFSCGATVRLTFVVRKLQFFWSGKRCPRCPTHGLCISWLWDFSCNRQVKTLLCDQIPSKLATFLLATVSLFKTILFCLIPICVFNFIFQPLVFFSCFFKAQQTACSLHVNAFLISSLSFPRAGVDHMKLSDYSKFCWMQN